MNKYSGFLVAGLVSFNAYLQLGWAGFTTSWVCFALGGLSYHQSMPSKGVE